MKKTFLFLLASSSLIGAQAPIYMAPPTTLPTSKLITEKKPAIAVAAQKAAPQGASDIMIISPENRAKDLQEAIKYLKQRSPTSKPTVVLTDGKSITNIIDIDVMTGGTLLIFKTSSMKGMQYKVVKIEDIDTLTNE